MAPSVIPCCYAMSNKAGEKIERLVPSKQQKKCADRDSNPGLGVGNA